MTKDDALIDIVRYIGVLDLGKERWFEQDDGRWYDRFTGGYITLEQLVDAVEIAVSEMDG